MGDNTKRGSRFFKSFHWKAAGGFFRNLVYGDDSKIRKYTLFILLCCGLAGVLIDLDHLLIEETQMVRPLHLPIWVGMFFVCIGYYTYIHRRVHKSGVE